MELLEYTVNIDASPQKVWETMLGADTYLVWASAGWPGSSFQGDWSEGSKMRFGGEEGGGTVAQITTSQPYEKIEATHVALIGEDGREDRDSEFAKGWVGSTEGYEFVKKNGGTKLIVRIGTQPEWRGMFDEGWPVALQALKELAESS